MNPISLKLIYSKSRFCQEVKSSKERLCADERGGHKHRPAVSEFWDPDDLQFSGENRYRREI